MAGGVFLNYRRQDSPAYAGWLYDQLSSKFGSEKIFRDVDAIEPGLDFVDVLNEQVEQCDLLVAVIGPGWLDARDTKGNRRLDDPNDFVRIELEAALNRDIRIVPVLVDGADMPDQSLLPDSLRPLSRRNAITVSHERFRSDTAPLVRTIENVLSEVDKRQTAGTINNPPKSIRAMPETEQPPKSASAAGPGPNSFPISATNGVAASSGLLIGFLNGFFIGGGGLAQLLLVGLTGSILGTILAAHGVKLPLRDRYAVGTNAAIGSVCCLVVYRLLA